MRFLLDEMYPSEAAARLRDDHGHDAALARLLDRWATVNPRPYVGPHWPS